MLDEEKMFKETMFVIEATSFEQQTLWEQFEGKMAWVHISEGRSFTVGKLAGFPVCVRVSWARLNSQLVMFYDATSRVVDHEMVETFLKSKCNPKWDNGTRTSYTDANNFHHAIQAINAKNQEKIKSFKN